MNENFAVKSTAFKSLLSLCRMGKASLKLTDVTIREIEANVQHCLKSTNVTLQSKTRDIRILRNFDDAQFDVLFREIDEDRLTAALVKLLKTDFDGANAEIISATEVSAAVVFEKYFQKQAPFGPAKKKQEFPDAFVLSALENWCNKNKQKLYLVSTDTDMQAGCSDRGPLLHLNSIGEFVDMVLREEDDETEFLAQFFVDNPGPIIEGVKAAFEDRMMYLVDEDGEGEASVGDVELGSAAVVSLEDNEAVLELDATVSFSAHVSYKDPDATWDYKSEEVERTQSVPVEVTIEFERGNRLEYKVMRAEVNGGESIRIYVDEDEESHWK
jgi:hypothetical protein